MAKKTTGSRGTAKKPRKQVKHPPTEHSRNYSQIAYEFALEASKDKKGRKHCKWVRLAAERHLADLKRHRFKVYPYRFDEWWANDVCDFAEGFPHVEGEWSSDTIQLEPAQIFILCCIFGWRRKDDDTRRFTAVYIEMARKGAKSTLTAVIAHYCLNCEGSVGPQIIVGATTGEQANKVFNPARKMAEKTPEYRDAFGVEVWAKSITSADSGGFIQPINSKSSTQDGWNPHVGILDEIHAHKDRGLYDVIKSAFGARKNPLMWLITTAGYNVQGVGYEQHQLVEKILQGIIQAEHYFGIIFTLDEDDDPLDESKWIKANPMIGITPTLQSMRSYADEARASPDTMAEFKTKRCNIWTTAKHGWLNMEYWKRNGSSIDFEALRGAPCYAGLDLATTTDIAAFVIAWLVDGRLQFKGRYYLPEDTVRPRTERGNVPYQRWADAGWLITTPGNTIDYDFIERDIDESMTAWDVQEIGFDRWNSSQLVNNLTDKDAPMVQMAQGPLTFNAPMREFERLWTSGKIDHGDDPVMKWMLSNLVARKDVNENMAPDKKNSMEKIDGPVALLMALGRAMVQEQKGNPYESRGLLTV